MSSLQRKSRRQESSPITAPRVDEATAPAITDPDHDYSQRQHRYSAARYPRNRPSSSLRNVDTTPQQSSEVETKLNGEPSTLADNRIDDTETELMNTSQSVQPVQSDQAASRSGNRTTSRTRHPECSELGTLERGESSFYINDQATRRLGDWSLTSKSPYYRSDQPLNNTSTSTPDLILPSPDVQRARPPTQKRNRSDEQGVENDPEMDIGHREPSKKRVKEYQDSPILQHGAVEEVVLEVNGAEESEAVIRSESKGQSRPQEKKEHNQPPLTDQPRPLEMKVTLTISEPVDFELSIKSS